MSTKTVVLFFIAAITLSINTLASQQTASTLRGHIINAAGEPLPGLKLIARNSNTGNVHSATTDSHGGFILASLEPGVYLLQNGQAVSSSPATSPTVNVQQASSTDLTLQQDAGGGLQIQADTVIASTDSTAVKLEIAEDPIEKMPQPNALGKDGAMFGAYNLALLAETATPGSILQIGAGPSIGGRPNSSNNFEINGIDNNHPAVPGPLLTVSNEAVTNFKVVQGQALSEMDHSTGGQLNVLLDQGTNLWHGGLYEYLNTRKLNAVEPSLANTLRTQRYDQSRMGLNAGGPIVRNKAFAFVNFEYLPLRANRIQLSPSFVPTESGYTAISTLGGISAINLSELRNRVGTAGSPTSFLTLRGVTVPIGLANTQVRTSTDSFNGIANIDWHVTATSKAAFRYGHNDSGTNAFGTTLPAFVVPGHTRALLGDLTYTAVLSSGSTVNAHAGYNRYDRKAGGESFPLGGLPAYPNIQVNDLNVNLGSNMDFSRIRSNTYQLGGWADWAFSGHRMRVGSDIRVLRSLFSDPAVNSGIFAYSSLDRFLMDLPPDAGAQQTFGAAPFVGNRTIASVFVQDKVRVHNLDLDLGLAYQYAQLPWSVRQQGSLASLNVPGLIAFNEPKSDRMNFEPHFGVAWAPGLEGTSLRAGAGLLYDTLNGAYSLIGPDMPGRMLTNTIAPAPGFLASGGLISPQTAAAGVNTFFYDQQLPYIVHWNGGVTQAIFGRLSAEFKYIGNHGVHLPFQTLLNDPSGISANRQLPVFFSNPGATALNNLVLTQQSLMASTNEFTAAGFSNPILAVRSDGTSWYNAGVFKLNERFTGGTQITGEYTYSDARSDTTGTILDLEFGRRMEQSIWNRKHRAVLTPVLDIASLPYLNSGLLHGAASSLTVMATLTYERGPRVPLFGESVGIPGTPVGSGVFVNPAGDSAISSGVVPLTNGTGQTVAFLAADPRAGFVAGAPGTFSAERPTLRLGDTRDIDLAITKKFAFHHWGKIEVRGDAFNLFNHPQFTGLPISTLGMGTGLAMAPAYLRVSDPQFGNLRGFTSGNPRAIQLAMHITF